MTTVVVIGMIIMAMVMTVAGGVVIVNGQSPVVHGIPKARGTLVDRAVTTRTAHEEIDTPCFGNVDDARQWDVNITKEMDLMGIRNVIDNEVTWVEVTFRRLGTRNIHCAKTQKEQAQSEAFHTAP
jgi:hypothetical protein